MDKGTQAGPAFRVPMPDELVTHILSYIPTRELKEITRVSSQYHRVASEMITRHVRLPRPTLVLYERIAIYQHLSETKRFWLECHLQEQTRHFPLHKSHMELAMRKMKHLRRITDKRRKLILADRIYNRMPEGRKQLVKTDAALTLLRKDYEPLTLDFLLGNRDGTIRA